MPFSTSRLKKQRRRENLRSNALRKLRVETLEERRLLAATPGMQWFQTAELTESADFQANDRAGREVSISGNTIVVSSEGDSDNGFDAGAAYVYLRNDAGTSIDPSDDTWEKQAKLIGSDTVAGDGFGHAVEIQGDTLVIGAFQSDKAGNGSTGAVYVFERTGSTWTEVAKLTASDGVAGDQFGTEVAIDGDTIVATAFQNLNVGNGNGAAYVFAKPSGGWSGSLTETAKLVSSDFALGDRFGRSVDVVGDTILIGADQRDTGSGRAYVFQRNDNGTPIDASDDQWLEQAVLLASDGAAGDQFGSIVVMDGARALITSIRDDIGGVVDAGSAYVFEQQTDGAWIETAKLTASDPGTSDEFGRGADIEGNLIVVGAWSGEIEIADSGSVYFFEQRSDGTWAEQGEVTSNDAKGDNNFGSSMIDLQGDTLVVGDPQHDHNGLQSGGAFVFVKSNSAVVAADLFESGTFAGGLGPWSADSGWTVSGDATIRTDTEPHSGTYHARLRRSTGDLQRTVDVASITDVRLQFDAKLISFEGSDRADVKVSGDGASWTTLHSFFNGDDDGQYKTYDLAVPDLGNTLHVRFDAGMSGSADYWFIDNVQVVGTPVPIGPPEITVSDATVVEGDRSLSYVDRFVPDNGVTQSFRNLVLGPDATGDNVEDLYVVSSGSDEVLRFDGVSGAFVDVFVAAGAGGLDDPLDLTFGPDGALYVTSRGTNGNPDNNSVIRFNGTTGGFVDVFATGLQRAISLDFGDDGNLYVGNRETNTVQYFDGITKQSLGTFAVNAAGSSGELRQVTFGLDLNSDGLRDLYVGNETTAEIYRYDAASGALLDTLGIPSSYGQLMWIEIGQDGSIYASVRPGGGDARILRLNSSTGSIADEIALGRDGWSTHISPSNILYVGGNGAGPIIDRIAPSSFAKFVVSISSTSFQPISVNFETAGATASVDNDFAAVSGTLLIEPGVTLRTIIVPTIDDSEVETDETFSVNLSNPVGATILDATGIGTIIDDESRREITISDGGAFEGDSSYAFAGYLVPPTAAFNIPPSDVVQDGPNGDFYASTRLVNGDLASIVRINHSTGEVDNDFILKGTGGLDIPREIAINGNWIYVANEGTNEVLRFNKSTGAPDTTPFVPAGAQGLSMPHGLTFDDSGVLYVSSQGTGEILTYDINGQFLGVFATVNFGMSNQGATDMLFDAAGDLLITTGGQTLKLVGSTGALTGFEIAGGGRSIALGPNGDIFLTARTPENDVNGIPSGEIRRYDPLSGALLEAISTPSNQYAWGITFDSDGNFYLAIPEPPGSLPRYAPGSSAVFNVNMSTPSANPVSVDFSTTNVTAMSGSDYAATSGTLIFQPGVTSQTIIVPTIDDAEAESIETFHVSLSNPIGGVIPNPTPAVGFIFDNDTTNEPPLVDAGDDQTLIDADGNGSEAVTLSGFAFDLDGSIDFAEWTLDGNVIGTTPIVNTTLPVGVHTITLTATDNQGASSSDTLVVTINAAPTEVVLFEDSFEVGSHSNDWNGKWVEDSQNDFFRSTQRSTHGARSAEVDGWAYNATLTMATPIDLSGHTSNTLTFDWLIEKGFDSGEYLSLDVSTNGGSSWSYDVRRLSGNVDAENTWHSESVDLSGFASSNLLIRFRSYVSSSSEDANIDNVKIVGFAAGGGGGGGNLLAALPDGFSGESSDDVIIAPAVLSVPVPAMDPLDVNQDGYTTPLDALLVVNWLNQTERGTAPASLDTNEDGNVTPIDMLLIVNKLNHVAAGERESVSLAPVIEAGSVDDFFGTMEEEEEDVLGGDLLNVI